jgi:hypothetical protein
MLTVACVCSGSDELRLVHPSVPNAVAERLGARSLRYLCVIPSRCPFCARVIILTLCAFANHT